MRVGVVHDPDLHRLVDDALVDARQELVLLRGVEAALTLSQSASTSAFFQWLQFTPFGATCWNGRSA